jgi:hypothetical protein
MTDFEKRDWIDHTRSSQFQTQLIIPSIKQGDSGSSLNSTEQNNEPRTPTATRLLSNQLPDGN